MPRLRAVVLQRQVGGSDAACPGQCLKYLGAGLKCARLAPYPYPGTLATERNIMLKWALIFAVISVIAGVLGFGGVAAGAAGIAKVLFFVFVVIFVVLTVLVLLGIGAVRK